MIVTDATLPESSETGAKRAGLIEILHRQCAMESALSVEPDREQARPIRRRSCGSSFAPSHVSPSCVSPFGGAEANCLEKLLEQDRYVKLEFGYEANRDKQKGNVMRRARGIGSMLAVMMTVPVARRGARQQRLRPLARRARQNGACHRVL